MLALELGELCELLSDEIDITGFDTGEVDLLLSDLDDTPDPADDAHGDASEDLLAVLRAVLEAYGLRDEAAVHAIRGLRSLLHGFVALELAGGFGLPLDIDESFVRLVRIFIGGLPRRDLTAHS